MLRRAVSNAITKTGHGPSRRHVHGRAGARAGVGDGRPRRAVRRHGDVGHVQRVPAERRAPVARGVGRPEDVHGGPRGAGGRAERHRPDGPGLRAVPVRVRVRHQAVRAPGGRWPGGRAAARRRWPADGRGGRRVRVRDARQVRVRGGRHGATAAVPRPWPGRAVRAPEGQPRGRRATNGRPPGRQRGMTHGPRNAVVVVARGKRTAATAAASTA